MSRERILVSALSLAGAYFFLSILVLWPIVDLLSSTWPLQLGNLQWRYGFLGLLAAYLHTPILGILLAQGLAYVFRANLAIRLLSILSMLGALILFVVFVLFPLDVLQIRSAVPEDRLMSFQVGALIAELKHFTAFVALLLIGLGGWRTSVDLGKKNRAAAGSELTAEVLKAHQKKG